MSSYPELYEAAERSAEMSAASFVTDDGRHISAAVDTLIEALRCSGAREAARYIRTHVEYARAIRNLGRPVKASAIPGAIGTVVTFDPMVRP